MADNDYDYNGMQAQLGLGGAGAGANPVGIPTPMPQVKHPGQAAVDAMAASQQAVMDMYSRTPAANMGLPPAPGSAGILAQQYQANMAAIQSSYLNPYTAGALSAVMGRPGYMPGSMPTPIAMTDPMMGLYRPFPSAPPPSIPPVAPTPFLPTPFSPSPAAPLFSTPYQYAQMMDQQRGDKWTGAMLSAPGVVARLATDYGAVQLGSGLGALAGARLGGTGGAALGSALGSLAGLYAGEQFDFAGVAQRTLNNMNPLHWAANRSVAVQAMTAGQLVAGPQMASGGTGMDPSSAAYTGMLMANMASSSQFQRETGGAYNQNDVFRIARLSASSGLLDMAQTSGQMVDGVREVAKAIKAIGETFGDPDVKRAVSTLASLKTKGYEVQEAVGFLKDLRRYARMSGTSPAQLMEKISSPAGMMYHQMGLSPAAGMGQGIGSYAMAKMSVASGSYTAQQLAMLGGTAGIAQRDVAANLSLVRTPMMAAALSQMDASGRFTLNPTAVQQLASGRMNINQMATGAVDNLLSATSQRGIGALGRFIGEQKELQDSLARAIPPETMKMLRFQKIMEVMQMAGLSGQDGFMTAALMFNGGDAEQAKQDLHEIRNPGFFNNLTRRRSQETARTNAAYARQAEASRPTWGDRLVVGGHGGFVGTYRNIGHQLGHNFMTSARGIGEAAGDFGTALRGGTNERVSQHLLASSPFQEAMLAEYVSSGDALRERGQMLQRVGQPITEHALLEFGGRGYGYSETLRNIHENWTGGSLAERRELARANGGWESWLGGYVGAAFTPFFHRDAAQNRAQLESVGRASQRITRALASATGADDPAYQAAMTRLNQALGGKGRDVVTAYTQNLRASFNPQAGAWRSGSANDGQLNQALGAAAQAHNLSASQLDTIRSDLETVGIVDLNAELSLSPLLTESATNSVAGIEDRQTLRDRLIAEKDSAANLFFGGAGTEARRLEAMQAIAGQVSSPHTLSVAALLAANQGDRAHAYLNSLGLPEEERGRVLADAKRVVEKLKGDDKLDLLAAGGRSMAAQSNRVIGTVGKHLFDTERQSIAFEAQNTGLRRTFANADFTKGAYKKLYDATSGVDMFRAIQSDASILAQLNETDRAQYDAWAANPQSAAGIEAADSFARTVFNRGLEGTAYEHSAYTSPYEEMLKKQDIFSSATMDTARKLNLLGGPNGENDFPSAVRAFTTASLMLYQTAQKMGNTSITLFGFPQKDS